MARRANSSPLFTELPPDLHERLRDRARATRRSVTAEVIIALESHLAAPASGEIAEPVLAKRGRPRKVAE